MSDADEVRKVDLVVEERTVKSPLQEEIDLRVAAFLAPYALERTLSDRIAVLEERVRELELDRDSRERREEDRRERYS